MKNVFLRFLILMALTHIFPVQAESPRDYYSDKASVLDSMPKATGYSYLFGRIRNILSNFSLNLISIDKEFISASTHVNLARVFCSKPGWVHQIFDATNTGFFTSPDIARVKLEYLYSHLEYSYRFPLYTLANSSSLSIETRKEYHRRARDAEYIANCLYNKSLRE